MSKISIIEFYKLNLGKSKIVYLIKYNIMLVVC